ncbi:CNPV237 ankyrin repeat protein [Canarypox virus]|uniref:CNPV237 ankyrin repeat protein n=1 Tax=Canarypox virus TaxID=44088 RepID=Q6VZB0_CNPV|nr:CNPV237 ankyrin repeat protein [Canarypox virus]AAR83583.1 CNPV237 ankyrin repeat protein [Canarypox virus]AWD84713.1 ankyrin repeat protein [Canarypox virus]
MMLYILYDGVSVSEMMVKLLLENKLISDEQASEIEQMTDDESKIIELLMHYITCEKKYILNLVLYKACLHKQLHLVNLLIKHGADVNKKLYYNDFSPFLTSIYRNNIDAAQLLLDIGCDYKKDIEKVFETIYYGAYKYTPEIIDLVIKLGVDVIKPDSIGRLPIHNVSKECIDKVVVDSLIRHYPDVDIKDNAGCTALNNYFHKGSEYIVLKLIEKGADINSVDKFGYTPLYVCAYNPKIVMILLQKGANINYVNEYIHYTPLESALFYRHIESSKVMVSYLLLMSFTNPDVNKDDVFIRNMDAINSNEELISFKMHCIEEINKMRSLNTEFVDRLLVNLKDIDNITTYYRKSLLYKLIRESESFPIYYNMYIRDVVDKCISKIDLIEELCVLIDRLDDYNYWTLLPYQIKEHILMQLKFSDLEYMLSQLKLSNTEPGISK